ncbi:DUF5103 domain-containing protein [Myroides sp. JBRI-B21084]|uniref:type IX secretion system plug protein n=1 Tax=Myroides sp. JBRI-B21084 TaxID=3119977 RepID=UPI0026E1FA6F|nr:DUF5103 domain-containing protein [Paenimyroides cloacae]WKW47387.1 DUF5103 domain-containing protein [Paenimyroides cloacae]
MRKILVFLIVFISALNVDAMNDPYYIKSVAFTQSSSENLALVPIFRLNEPFVFSFEDLNGIETDYFYKIVHCDENWQPSNLKITEYISGIQPSRFVSYQTSFNTFQPFVHYSVQLPNSNTKITISGNYIIEIYNDANEKVIERRFVLYEDLAKVALEVKKTRNLNASPFKQNIYLNIDFETLQLQNPKQNVQVVVLQNGQWYNALTQIKPQYVISNQFKYQYDEETNFWAGNEFLYFDNSDMRQVNNTVERISRTDLFQTFLWPKIAQSTNKSYSFYQDVNGGFKSRNALRGNNITEADYAWVYFGYKLNKLPSNQKLYIVGMFNNYQLTPDYELQYDDTNDLYKTALLLKQGFTNYKYVITNEDGKVLENLNPEGNFFETENEYYALVYYKAETDRFARVIGLGKADSKLITN